MQYLQLSMFFVTCFKIIITTCCCVDMCYYDYHRLTISCAYMMYTSLIIMFDKHVYIITCQDCLKMSENSNLHASEVVCLSAFAVGFCPVNFCT